MRLQRERFLLLLLTIKQFMEMKQKVYITYIFSDKSSQV